MLRLPLLEEFHIDLGFDLDTHAAPRATCAAMFPTLSDERRRLVPAVAAGLPLVPALTKRVAKGLGDASASDLLLAKMLADGRIRRIGAVIRHRRLGYEANAMVVWDVPDARSGTRPASSPGSGGDPLLPQGARAARVALQPLLHGARPAPRACSTT